MKIIVLGDTHGILSKAEKALKRENDCELILHTGDFFADAQRLSNRCGIPFLGVIGNCDRYDFRLKEPRESLFELAGKRLLLLHGHEQKVKTGLLSLLLKGKEQEADIVIFGHTHRAEAIMEEGILLLNPGSISLPRDGAPSYALLKLGEELNWEIKRL